MKISKLRCQLTLANFYCKRGQSGIDYKDIQVALLLDTYRVYSDETLKALKLDTGYRYSIEQDVNYRYRSFINVPLFKCGTLLLSRIDLKKFNCLAYIKFYIFLCIKDGMSIFLASDGTLIYLLRPVIRVFIATKKRSKKARKFKKKCIRR